jgi:hypothetical protein
MLNADVIATTERFLIGAAIPARYFGMLVLITIIYIWAAMVSVIFACTLDAVTKAATLNISLILRWGRIP